MPISSASLSIRGKWTWINTHPLRKLAVTKIVVKAIKPLDLNGSTLVVGDAVKQDQGVMPPNVVIGKRLLV